MALVYARGIRRAKRQEELVNIHEKDVRIEDWCVVLMACGRRTILSAMPAIESARLRPARASQYSRETLRPSAGPSPQTPANGGHEEVARRFQLVSKCKYISSVLLSKCNHIYLRMPACMC